MWPLLPNHNSKKPPLPAPARPLLYARWQAFINKYYMPLLAYGLRRPHKVLIAVVMLFFGSLTLLSYIGISAYPLPPTVPPVVVKQVAVGAAGHKAMATQSSQALFEGICQVMLAALPAMFTLLALQLRSIRQAFVAFCALPLAVSGALIMLYCAGCPFSFMAFIGMASLVGMVVNNAALLVAQAGQLFRAGLPKDKAIVQAAKAQAGPVLLNAVLIAGGVLPLALGSNAFMAPMGWAIIGGVLVSAVLGLLITPVLYQVMGPKQ